MLYYIFALDALALAGMDGMACFRRRLFCFFFFLIIIRSSVGKKRKRADACMHVSCVKCKFWNVSLSAYTYVPLPEPFIHSVKKSSQSRFFGNVCN